MSNLISKFNEGRVIEAVLEGVIVCYVLIITGYGALP